MSFLSILTQIPYLGELLTLGRHPLPVFSNHLSRERHQLLRSFLLKVFEKPKITVSQKNKKPVWDHLEYDGNSRQTHSSLMYCWLNNSVGVCLSKDVRWSNLWFLAKIIKGRKTGYQNIQKDMNSFWQIVCSYNASVIREQII